MKSLGLCLLLVVGLALPAQAQSLDEKLQQARIVAKARVVLAQDEALRAFTFQPTVRGDVLTLAGTVETQAQKERAEEVARGLDGVRTVVNEVRVANATGPDLSDLPPPAAAPATAPAASEPAAQSEQAAPAEAERVFHTVRSGDTLGAIARRYGVSVRQIQQLNGLRGTSIRAGQRLRVK